MEIILTLLLLVVISFFLLWEWKKEKEEAKRLQEEQLKKEEEARLRRLQEDEERLSRLKERILSGEISPISPPTSLMLQPNEKTYYAAAAALMKKRSGYVSFEDIGTLIVTNKRLMFIGLSKTINYKLTKILALAPIENSICIVIEGRQNPIILQLDYPREAAGYISFLQILARHQIELPIFSAALRASFLQEMQTKVGETSQESY